MVRYYQLVYKKRRIFVGLYRAPNLQQVNPLVRIPYFERNRALLSVFLDSGEETDLEVGMQRLADEAAAVGGEEDTSSPKFEIKTEGLLDNIRS